MSNAIYDEDAEMGKEIDTGISGAREAVCQIINEAKLLKKRDENTLADLRERLLVLRETDYTRRSLWVDDERNDHYSTLGINEHNNMMDHITAANKTIDSIVLDLDMEICYPDAEKRQLLKSGITPSQNNPKEPEFYAEIPFDKIEDMKLSISDRDLINNSSGLIRDTTNPVGYRKDTARLDDVYGKDKEKARTHHRTYLEHAQMMGLVQPFLVIGNGNLGNNLGHVAWQEDLENKLFSLSAEPLESRFYGALIVNKTNTPSIQKCMFKGSKIYTPKGEKYYLVDGQNWIPKENKRLDWAHAPNEPEGNLIKDLKWATTGQMIVESNQPVKLMEIADQFYDIRHIFNWIDYGEHKEENIEKLRAFYAEADKEGWKNTVQKFMKASAERSRFLHSIVGIRENSLVVAHQYGTIEEIAQKLVNYGLEDGIILDQGGSCGCYAQGLFPKDGFVNTSSYFRDNRISAIGIGVKS